MTSHRPRRHWPTILADLLRHLYDEAIHDYWDESAYRAAFEQEREEAESLGAAS